MTRANPNMRSSTGAKRIRPSPNAGGGPSSGVLEPRMAAPEYRTIRNPVRTPFVTSWKNTMMA